MSDIFELPAYGWTPRQDQRGLWRGLMNDDMRRSIVVAHRRWGKDELGLQAMAVKAMQRTGSYWYCLPEYEHARKAIWEMVNWRTGRTRIADAFPPEIVAKKDDQSMMLWLESGSTVQLIGSDRVDSLVGGGQVGIVMSEAAISNPRAMQLFRPILEESGGWELQISTPRGKNHLYRAFTAASEDQRAGVPGVSAYYVPATESSVFDGMQLARIKYDLIREHGSKMGTAIYNQEYMCDWYAAVVGAVWGDELSMLEAEGRSGAFPHDKRFPVHTSWDLGIADPTVILFWQDIQGMHRLIDAYENTALGLTTYLELLAYKKDKHRYMYAEHVAPHDINHREKLRGVSLQEEAKRLGVNFVRMPTTRIPTQVSCAAKVISRMQVNTDNPDVEKAFSHFKEYRFQVDSATKEIMPNPVHDSHSHASSALMTYALRKESKLAASGEIIAHEKFDPRKYGPAPYSRGGFTPGQLPRGSAFG